MKAIKVFGLVFLSLWLFISCVKNGIGVSGRNDPLIATTYSFRPDIVISPIDAMSSSLTIKDGYGQLVEHAPLLKWNVANPKTGFNGSVSAETKASYLEDLFSMSGMISFEPDRFYCCYAGVSGPIKIYADTDIDGYQAGEDLSDLFAVSPAYEQLVGTTYPEMKTLHFFAERDQYVEVPVKEYFAVGTAPLISISYGCVLHTIDGFEYLMEDILDGKLILHFELPITGVNSNGEEESTVLTGTINNS